MSHWHRFLNVRRDLIEEFRREGKSCAEIAGLLSMDTGQVFLISRIETTVEPEVRGAIIGQTMVAVTAMTLSSQTDRLMDLLSDFAEPSGHHLGEGAVIHIEDPQTNKALRTALASMLRTPVAEALPMSSTKKTQHDIDMETNPRTGGEHPKAPDPSNLEQGSKNPDTRDAGDRADKPTPKR